MRECDCPHKASHATVDYFKFPSGTADSRSLADSRNASAQESVEQSPAQIRPKKKKLGARAEQKLVDRL